MNVNTDYNQIDLKIDIDLSTIDSFIEDESNSSDYAEEK